MTNQLKETQFSLRSLFMFTFCCAGGIAIASLVLSRHGSMAGLSRTAGDHPSVATGNVFHICEGNPALPIYLLLHYDDDGCSYHTTRAVRWRGGRWESFDHGHWVPLHERNELRDSKGKTLFLGEYAEKEKGEWAQKVGHAPAADVHPIAGKKGVN
jgi:hypothetical protein